MIKLALISVSNKHGIVEFASALSQLGVQILSTGGTADFLRRAHVPVKEVSEYTEYPEILDGRVKTLHPKIHAGILARRDRSSHDQSLKELEIEPIDLVVVNLYPFVKTIADANVSNESALEMIDIGGPTLVRAAAKNYQDVGVVVDPADYPAILRELHERHTDAAVSLSVNTRLKLAAKAFSHTAHYDQAITHYLQRTSSGTHEEKRYPPVFHLALEKREDLRYGENPQQTAALYQLPHDDGHSFINYEQLQGKPLSYNNLLDANSAWACVQALSASGCVVVKHNNPCGAACADSTFQACELAFGTDPTSAFGGIVAFNQEVDEATALFLSERFLEVVVATGYSEAARSVLAAKNNLRLLQVPLKPEGVEAINLHNNLQLTSIDGGVLIQTLDQKALQPHEMRVVTRQHPTPTQMQSLLLAWQIVKFVKSNAIVCANQHQVLGIGAGQMSRVDAVELAIRKARNAGFSLEGAAVASDGFFPFKDGLLALAEAGITSVIQPGGSIRDEEIIATADDKNMAMVLTGTRHFRH